MNEKIKTAKQIQDYTKKEERRTKDLQFQLKEQLISVMISYLHCTSNEVALEVSLPRLLFATQRYSPLSVLLTFVIVNCFLSSDKLILPIAFTGDPFLVHDIVGGGCPVALQDKVTFSPSDFRSAFG